MDRTALQDFPHDLSTYYLLEILQFFVAHIRPTTHIVFGLEIQKMSPTKSDTAGIRTRVSRDIDKLTIHSTMAPFIHKNLLCNGGKLVTEYHTYNHFVTQISTICETI